MSLRVALIDDHQLFRERLRALLEEDRDIEIVAEAGSGQEILDIAPTTEIDVACMDIHMPGINGIEATRRLLAFKPEVRVIGLSAYADQHYVEAMLDAGAVGYFTKGDAGEGLLQAVHTATREQPCFGADVAPPPAPGAAAAAQPDKTTDTDVASLGAKELEVMRLIAKGLALPQIADSLAMDTAMVGVYRRNIVRKLHLADDAALDEYARRIDPDTN
ncbi:MAG: response regulator transcription factor [Burkholderiales bacterium]|nr:response regulator transcription factor [Burkholderiales bacterium]